MSERLGPKLVAEFLGSLSLVMVIVSSAILAYNILEADIPLSVLYIGLATGFWLFALIETLGPVSGCHINPAVTIAMMTTKDIDVKTGSYYIVVQIAGGLVGTLASHLMFIHVVPTVWTISDVARPAGCYLAEFIGTFILIGTIYGCIRGGSKFTGLAIGLVVGGGIITTSSTMFVNPQVTIARIFTYAIAGIRPLDAGPFIIAEILGAIAAAVVFSYLYPKKPEKELEE